MTIPFLYQTNNFKDFKEAPISFMGINEGFDLLSVWVSDDKKKYYSIALILKNSLIKFIDFTLDSSIPFRIFFEITLDYNSKYVNAYFDHQNKMFYWMSANSTSEFRSGYSTYQINSDNSSVYNLCNEKNINSPFNLL